MSKTSSSTDSNSSKLCPSSTCNYNSSHDHNHKHGYEIDMKNFLIQTSISFILLLLGLFFNFYLKYDLYASICYLMVLVISGREIFIEGIKSLLFRKRFYIEFLVAVASIGALLIGEFAEGSTVVFLFSIANFLESYASGRAEKSIEALLREKPVKARIIRNGIEVEVDVEEAKVGDTIIIKPGEKIPLDGIVIEGNSTVNEAPLTGESIPVEKRPGDKVYSGTINLNGVLKVKVEKEAKDTLFSRIIELVKKARKDKSEIERFIEKFSQYYTPTILLISLLISIIPPFLFGSSLRYWVYRSLTLLVISCPCALAISTPVAIVSGLTNAAKNGVLIKGGKHLEHITKVNILAFDKTGTLTKGQLKVTKIIPLNEKSEKEILEIASSIGKYSNHPIDKAILREAEKRGVKQFPVNDFRAFPGKGIAAKVNGELHIIGNEEILSDFNIEVPLEIINKLREEGITAIAIADRSKVIGIIGVEDEIREESIHVIQQLKKRGIRIVMITGDNEVTAKNIAKKLGINEFRANLLPEDKIKVINELMDKHNNHVIMVGDGINDTPALANACVGIAMGTGTEIAIESGDIVLMKPSLNKIPYIMDLSRKTMKIVKGNVIASIGIKAAIALLAILGLVGLWVAVAIGDMGLSFMVIINALRLAAEKY